MENENEVKKQEQEQPQEQDDISIAERARKEIEARDEKIKKLTKQLAEKTLLTDRPEEEEGARTKEDCLKVIGNKMTSNYDYAQAVVDLHDIEVAEGRKSPLGENGEEVRNFFADCIEQCDGNKNKFCAIYQANIGEDEKQTSGGVVRRK